MFIADCGNSAVRRVDEDGVIETVAGGTPGTVPDGGAATALTSPSAVAVYSDSLFVTESLSPARARVRTLSGGMLFTLAGTGEPCAPTTADCGDGGPSASSQLLRPACSPW